MNSDEMTFRPDHGGANVEVRELLFKREEEAGLVFLSCESLPDVFIATRDSEDVRYAIDSSLKSAYHADGTRVQVYTNGKIDGPSIDVMVKLTR